MYRKYVFRIVSNGFRFGRSNIDLKPEIVINDIEIWITVKGERKLKVKAVNRTSV